MTSYDASDYGERFADVYDHWYQTCDPYLISTLEELARGGPVLELGIGTGRIALPLINRGLEVHGIDASLSMVEKLRNKPGGDEIPVNIGNFADVDIEGRFSLIFIVFNTFFGLLSQNEQIRCFQNVAKHLSEDGLFLIETFVPDIKRFDAGEFVKASKIKEDEISLNVPVHDSANQRLSIQHVVISEKGIRFFPVRFRYAWHPEMDLMARLAGLRLRYRWGKWNRVPFTSASEKHISVYERMRDEWNDDQPPVSNPSE